MLGNGSDGAGGLYSRRDLIKTGGAVGLTAAGVAFLAGCGGGGSAATGGTSSSSGGGGEGGTITPGVGKELADLLGVTEEDAKLSAGQTWNVGAALALSGQGAIYGQTMAPAIELAIEQIPLAGGPKIDYTLKDHKSGDPAVATQIGRDFGAAGIGAQLTSFNAILGAELPSMEQFKIMSFDGGGGVGPFPGRPYFWGTKATTPYQVFGGQLHWLKEAHPEMQKLFFVYGDQGEEQTEAFFETLEAALELSGQQLVGSTKFPFGASDFSATVRTLQSAPEHDLVLFVGYGTDPGYFMKQYKAAGLETQVFGSELTAQAQEIAGSAYEGTWFAFDYFDYEEPQNPLSKFFVKNWEAKNGAMKAENFYSANYYESTLALWELARRVLKKGGDINSGEDLQKALEEEPMVQSVYGGNANENGSMAFSLKTHNVSERPLAVVEVDGAKSKLLANFNISPPPDFQLKMLS